LIPRSENPKTAITEEIVIHSPYRSVPRYFNVKGTLIRPAKILTSLENPEAALVRNARRYRSFERPSGVLRSNARKRATDNICFAALSDASWSEEFIRTG
jgi:hypothetical protein